MNVDILENNPNWRWFLLFAGGALVITFIVWLITKYINVCYTLCWELSAY